MAIDYGTDVSTWSGSGPMRLDPLFRLITGNRLLAEVALRRVFCAPGSYPQAPKFRSIDILAQLNRSSKEIDTVALAAQAQSAIMDDERFSAASVSLKFEGGTLKMKMQLTPSQSAPFSLVVTVQNVSTNPTFEIAFPS